MALLSPTSPAANDDDARVDIVHVPFTYFPDPVGGTEVYVARLIAAMNARGFRSAVAAPADGAANYRHESAAVYRFPSAHGFARAWGESDEKAAKWFETLLATLRPRIVHLHAHTSFASERLVDAAHKAAAKVILTYHTPTVSCARGDLMLWGDTPCDGHVEAARCASCVLHQHGVPAPVRMALSLAPPGIGGAVGKIGMHGGAFTALRMKALMQAKAARLARLLDKVDRIVAVCDWVADVLRANGAAPEKMAVSRQGVALRPRVAPRAFSVSADRPVRVAFFGRLDTTKGVDTLISALAARPNLNVALDIYSPPPTDATHAYASKIEMAASADARIHLCAPLAENDVITAMARYDLIAVPSRWLESGPLVVLEAFAAGIPVLGARLGGIAELVSDGVDGVLAPHDDIEAWACALDALASDRGRLAQLRGGVKPPRTMEDVADDMVRLYGALTLVSGDEHASA